MKFCADIQQPYRMYDNDFGDPLTFQQDDICASVLWQLLNGLL